MRMLCPQLDVQYNREFLAQTIGWNQAALLGYDLLEIKVCERLVSILTAGMFNCSVGVNTHGNNLYFY